MSASGKKLRVMRAQQMFIGRLNGVTQCSRPLPSQRVVNVVKLVPAPFRCFSTASCVKPEAHPATSDTNNHAGEADLHDVMRRAALYIPAMAARTSLVHMNNAVEEGPKENVGEQPAEQSRREEGSAATQETVPGVHGAQHKHEPERQRCGEIEEETPEARQTQDAGSATGQRGQRRPAVLEHCAVVPHGSLAVRDSLARFFLLRAHLASVLRHPVC